MLLSEPDAFQVLVLAVVQGLTEFLPVSSSGHLVLVEHLTGVEEDQALLLAIALHVGTLFAVLAVYRSSVWQVTRDFFTGRFREGLMIVLGTLPTVLVGLFARDLVKEAFAEARSAGVGLLITAVILIVSDWMRRRRQGLAAAPTGRTEVGVVDALLIGCAQAFAILPGVSRSGSTIGTGLLRGLEPAAAARFSFLLSIPAILGAAVLEGKDLIEESAESVDGLLLAAGLVVAALVGWVALRLLLAFLARGAFRWFALYCALLGTAVLLFLD